MISTGLLKGPDGLCHTAALDTVNLFIITPYSAKTLSLSWMEEEDRSKCEVGNVIGVL